MPITATTIEEWDAEIKKHSLHLKYDSQLFFLEESIETKIPRVNRDLMEILFFPDAKKKEICQNYIDSGEITNYFDLETPVPISLKDKEKIDAEFSHEVDFYTAKLGWLKDKLTCCKKEMELRADGLVERIPKGTTYYVDFDNGNDLHDGTHTAETDSNEDGPWATLDKCGDNLAAADVAIVRRGMTQTVSADLDFANDGTIVAPITIEADYGGAWGQYPALSGTGTATLTFGSKTIIFSADISGVLAAGDWIYVFGDATKDFAYEVASVSTVTVTLYLPYKGGQAGSGKTVYNMGDAPIWNTAAGDYEVNLDQDVYWIFQGIHLRGTDVNGVMEVETCCCVLRKDCIFEGNGAADYGTKYMDTAAIFDRKCRHYNVQAAFLYNNIWQGARIDLKDCYIDCNSVAGSYALKINGVTDIHSVDVEAVNTATGDVYCNSDLTIGQVRSKDFRNNKLTTYVFHNTASITPFRVEDYNQIVSDNRQYGVSSTNAITLQSETTKVRAGGGASSIKVTPTTDLNNNWEIPRLLLFEYPIYAATDVAKTYTVYLSSDDDTDWDADPLATELWVEAEYWGHATNVARNILKSTEVCNNFDADDTVWDTLTVTVTPLQTGVLYLRGYYCKPKEAAKSNIFYCDTVVGVA